MSPDLRSLGPRCPNFAQAGYLKVRQISSLAEIVVDSARLHSAQS